MVGPSPPIDQMRTVLPDKDSLRTRMRKLRREHVAAIPESVSRLLFLRPPSPLAALAPEGTCVGLYQAIGAEAPTRRYAEWLYENGRTLCIPWFADSRSPMQFRSWANPYDDTLLEPGPFEILQPLVECEEVVPPLAVVPLLAFNKAGDRLGQGGGHYDRWLAAHPEATPVGLAWDCQLVDALAVEEHDRRLAMIVTPTRMFEGAS